MKLFFSRIGIVLLLAIVFFLPVRSVVAQNINYPVVVSVSNGAPKPIPRELWGVNLQGFLPQPALDSPGAFLAYLTPSGATAAQNMGIQFVRFPGGSAANAYNWGGATGNAFLDLGGVQRPFMKISDGLLLSSLLGAEMMYQANLTAPLNQPAFTCQEIRDIITLAPDHYDTVGNRSLIRYIELGHDQWLPGGPINAALYQQIASRCAHVIKSIDPTIKVGVVSYGSLDESPNNAVDRPLWNQMIAVLTGDRTCGITNNLPCVDFVSDHIAPRALHVAYPAPFLGQSTIFNITNLKSTFPINPAAPLNVIAMGKAIDPNVPVGFTEWNLFCQNVIPQFQPAGTTEQGLFTALSLFTMLEEDVGLAAFHNLSVDGTLPSEAGCGLLALSGNVQLSASGQAFALTSVIAGGTLLNTGVGAHNSLLSVPENLTCPNRDCLDIGAGGFDPTTIGGISNLDAFSAQVGNDLYIFLINRDSDSTNLFQATINFNPFVNYNPAVAVTADILAGVSYRNRFFQQATVNVPYDSTTTPGQIVVPLPGVSMARVHIAGFFNGAPAPSPTPLAPPNLDITEMVRIINSKRPPVEECTVDIMPYIFASIIYIMVIRFAIGIATWWKQVTLVMCFVIGLVSYFLCNMVPGFMFAVIMSLFLW